MFILFSSVPFISTLSDVISSISSQGILAKKENPSMLMMFPICILLNIIEYVPSYAQECSSRLIPFLFSYISHSDLTIYCVYGFGVCAMFGGLEFDSVCGQAVSILLGAAGADQSAQAKLALNLNEINVDNMKDNVYSSLFKIAIYKKNILGIAAEQLLQFCFQNFPLNSDIEEAKAVHTLFIDLLVQKDLRLLGSNGRLENLSQVPFFLFICHSRQKKQFAYLFIYLKK